MSNYKEVANALINVTQDVLMSHVETWRKENHPNAKLTLRVGGGNRTCLSHLKSNVDDCTLTYGVKMIQSKLRSKQQFAAWRTGYEITQRGYFNGVLNAQTALASVVCHEFAHWIQVLNAQRNDNGSHNEYFYKVLDRIHSSGAAKRVLDKLCQLEGIRALQFIEVDRPLFSQENILSGQKVKVQTGVGGVKTLLVKRTNKRTVSGTMEGMRCRVSYTVIIEVLD